VEFIKIAGLLIPALPLLAFLLIITLAYRRGLSAALIGITAMAGSFGLSCYVLFYLLTGAGASADIASALQKDAAKPAVTAEAPEKHAKAASVHVKTEEKHGKAAAHENSSAEETVHAGPVSVEYEVPWLYLGDVKMHLGILINPLTSIMLIVVTLVSMLVQIYSTGYMKGDRSFAKFFAYISLFSFSMLGIVLANNMLQLFVFWELVGLCSYLLIGFWYEKPEAAEAGKKAFVVTRFGDFGFLVGVVILSTIAGTFSFKGIEQYVSSSLAAGTLSVGLLTVIMLLLFSGAVGKSAQFPLHVWLPDAMEGPTPVSALIHAATMVAAGVFMVARLFTLFMSAPQALLIVAYIGGFTAIFAASIALVQNDIKRVLAFSTLSQLGYMMLALGVGGYTSGMFHLTTHAFFKALLFLGAGSVIHAMHTNDIREMGGLHKKMPITSWTFLIATLAISGIYPLSGFWSKDEILVNILESGHTWLYWVASITAFMTAFYMMRLYLMTFTGEARDKHAYDHAHESPLSMTVPLMLLAVLSVFAGFAGVPGSEKSIYTYLYAGAHPHETHFNMPVAVKSSVIAVAGILLALVMYMFRLIKPETVRKVSGPVYNVLYNKYYVDEFYMFLIKNIFFTASAAIKWFDRHVVDGLVNLSAFLCRWGGAKLRLTITGRVQNYAFVIFAGLIFVVLAFAAFGNVSMFMTGGR